MIRLSRFVLLPLAVLLLLLTGTTSVLARVVSSSATFLYRSLEMRIGLFANDNPAVYCDPTGRIATGFHQGAIKGDYYEAGNTAQGVGKFAGQVGVGFVPGIGQAADIRDLTAAWNVGRTQGWTFGAGASLAMAGAGLIPTVGDAIKSGVKPLLGTAGPAVAKTLPGPSLPPRIADTFSDSAYINRQLPTNTSLFKYHGIDNQTGRKFNWVTNQKYSTEAELRNSLAIRKDWGVDITRVSEFNIPKGTWVSEGSAASQGVGYPGSGYQGVIQNLPRSWIIRTDKAFH